MLGYINKPADMGMPAFLNREYRRRRDRNPRYSSRAFARDLGCDHATVSQWMRRTRPMSDAALDRMTEMGGRLLLPKQVLPDGDPMALAMDPTGRPFGLMTPR
jgi:hypothetical protein